MRTSQGWFHFARICCFHQPVEKWILCLKVYKCSSGCRTSTSSHTHKSTHTSSSWWRWGEESDAGGVRPMAQDLKAGEVTGSAEVKVIRLAFHRPPPSDVAAQQQQPASTSAALMKSRWNFSLLWCGDFKTSRLAWYSNINEMCSSYKHLWECCVEPSSLSHTHSHTHTQRKFLGNDPVLVLKYWFYRSRPKSLVCVCVFVLEL